MACFATWREERGLSQGSLVSLQTLHTRREGEMEISTRKCIAMMLALLAGALGACGTAQTSLDFSSYAHRVSDDVVVIYWNCSRPSPGVVQVQGVANNPFYPQPIQDLEIRVYGVNTQGGNVSRARGSTQDYLLQMNSPSAFKIDLKTVGGEVRYDIVYSYMAGEGGRMGLVGGGMERQNFARDICAGLAP